jgi:hypothetical protein
MHSGYRNLQMTLDVSFTIFRIIQAPLMKLYESTVKLEPVAKYLKQINTKNIVQCSATHENGITTNQNDPLMPITLFQLPTAKKRGGI